MEMVIGVGAGAVAATAFTPMLVNGLVAKVMPGAAANPRLKPLWTLLTGGLAAALAGAVFRRGKVGTYMLVGGGVAAVIDLLNQYVVPMLPGLSGYGDYVQLPYAGMRGMGDYVQLPYSGMSGMGSPQQVEAGIFGYGSPQQVEAGIFGYGDDASGTFAQSF